MLKFVGNEAAQDEGDGRSLLDEIAREGARRMLVAALDTEVAGSRGAGENGPRTSGAAGYVTVRRVVVPTLRTGGPHPRARSPPAPPAPAGQREDTRRSCGAARIASPHRRAAPSTVEATLTLDRFRAFDVARCA
jgi:hypothetical protein